MYPNPPQENPQSFLEPNSQQGANAQDFLYRFNAPDAHVPPQEASQYFDQYAQANHPGFQRAMGTYMSQQMDPNQFAQGVQNLPPQQKSGLVGPLMNALQSHGVNVGALAGKLGLSSTDPNQMQQQDLSAVAGYAQQNYPGALQQTAQEHPSLLKTAMGHPFITGALGLLAAHTLSNLYENHEDREMEENMEQPYPEPGPNTDTGTGSGFPG